MRIIDIRNKLIEKGLKVTPQRIAILTAVTELNNHPTAEQILDYIRRDNPNISTATVYKVLDILVEQGLLKKVKTDNDIKRYDAIIEPHHHLYYSDSEKIEDYTDESLDDLLRSYFKKNTIPGFRIEDIKLQIIGRGTKH